MTHSGGKPHSVGDKGQRYEITFYSLSEKRRRVLGWADRPEHAEQLAQSANLHPDWSDAKVMDRHRLTERNTS